MLLARALALAVLLAAIAACAGPPGSGPAAAGGRLRCADHTAGGPHATQRPLFFLLCVESP